MAETLHCYEDVEKYISNLEITNYVRYVKQSIRKTFPKGNYNFDRRDILKRKVYFKDDGTAFVSLGKEMRECSHGPDRHTEFKKKYHKDKNILSDADHGYVTKSKKLIQSSKKLGCKAKVCIAAMLVFPQLKVSGSGNLQEKRKISKKLKEMCSNEDADDPEYNLEYKVEVDINHSNHHFGELAGHGMRVDSRIIGKVNELVKDGVKAVPEMKRHLNMFVQQNLKVKTSSNNQRFYSVDAALRSQIYRAHIKLQFSGDDQQNLTSKINQWKQDSPGDNFFYRPVYEGSEKDFIFVHQTAWQRRILERYGQQICLLDATYKTSKYDCPLFFICVLTNVGYTIVGSFVVAHETVDSISEGLQKLKEWSPDWSPVHFMTDFDEREIQAIEKTFKGCFVFLCDFHREQAWTRWLRSIKNGLHKDKDNVLPLLRNIANAETEEVYKTNQSILTSSEYWHKLKDWFGHKWLANDKRWVHAFRPLFKINTTNGVERQHRTLKQTYLRNSSQGTLTGLMDILVERFLPDAKAKYTQQNIQSMPEYSKYVIDLPLFLRNRPKKFVTHCLKRMFPSCENFSNNNFTVLCDIKVEVRSPDSGKVYNIDISLPDCTCPDWHKFHLPCKHMLGMFSNLPAYGWDFLPEVYRESPLFGIDSEVIEQGCKEAEPLKFKAGSNMTEPTNIRKCESELKSIQSLLYKASEPHITQTLEYLTEVRVKLHDEMKSDLPLLHSTLKKRKPFKPLKRRDKRSKLELGGSDCNISEDGLFNVPDEIIEEIFRPQSQLIVHEMVQIHLDDEPQELLDMEEVVDKIWSNKEQLSSSVLGQVGPFQISDSSIHYLKTTLSDEVIDAFLHLLVEKRENFFHLNCVVMTAIFNGNSGVHEFLRKMDIYQQEFVIGAYNEGGNHWTLIILDPKRRQILYLNPLGELFASEQQILQNWYSFLNERYRNRIDSYPAETWELRTCEHARQTDSLSCGVYVLVLAERYIHGKGLMFQIEIDKCRKRIGALILANAVIGHNDKNVLEDNVGLEINKVTVDCEEGDAVTAGCEEQLQEVSDGVQKVKSKVNNSKVPLINTDRRLRNILKKRKSNSYVYSSPKRRKQTYCICKKEEDGRVYWQCGHCKQWFHPGCLGRDEGDSPDPFVCEQCMERHVSTWNVEGFEVVEESTNDEDEEDECNFLIGSEIASKLMTEAYKRCLAICSSVASKRLLLNSEVAWLQQHCMFLIKGDGTLNKGFGYGVYSQKALLLIEKNIINTFLKRKSIYSFRTEIYGIANAHLKHLCEQDNLLGYSYVKTVLFREALVAMMQKVTDCDYKTAQESMQLTEAKTTLSAVMKAVHHRKQLKLKYPPIENAKK